LAGNWFAITESFQFGQGSNFLIGPFSIRIFVSTAQRSRFLRFSLAGATLLALEGEREDFRGQDGLLRGRRAGFGGTSTSERMPAEMQGPVEEVSALETIKE
jgi:hypothetical protein